MPQGAAYGPESERAQTTIGGGKSTASANKGRFDLSKAGRALQLGGLTGLTTPAGGLAPFSGQALKDLIGGKRSGSSGSTAPITPVSPAGQPGPVAIDTTTGLPFGGVPDQTGDTGLRGPTDASGTSSGTSTSALGVGGPYQGAFSNWQNRGFLDRVLSNLPFGFGYQKPNVSQPSSYAGSDFHFGVNPGSFLGSALGTMAPVGGSLLGMLGGLGYDAAGGKDVILGGPGATSIAGLTPGVGAPGVSGPQSAVAGGNPTGGGGTGPTEATGGTIPSATPAASQPSASVPVQAAPAAPANPNQPGQRVGGTIVTGANSVAPNWPWGAANG